MTLDLACAFAPTASTPDHIATAERLGYTRAWVYDSPSLFTDLWITLARAADRTTTIGLAPGVAVPAMRHVIATAGALVSLEAIAPGRISCGVGAGGTSMMMIGKRPGRWSDVSAYASALRGLLRGEQVTWDRAAIALNQPDSAPTLPVDIPILLAAEGPRGEAAAREHGDGIITIFHTPQERFSTWCRQISGTVIDDDEDPAGDRVYEAAGPAAMMHYRAAYGYGDRDRLAAMPGGTALAAEIDALPAEKRFSSLWHGQSVHLTDIDRRCIPPAAVAPLTTSGTRKQLRAELAELEALGVTEIVYAPSGPDVGRELTAFAEVLT